MLPSHGVALTPDTQLGPYRIVAAIGAGGMGEVYRARDTRLNRDVAIKVLPSHLTSDVVALSRFEREAKAVAALSHPNIVAIHDIGREGATSYAVMELLEGETLRQRLEGGALPPRKAIDYATQIARALAAAHERGIVHRDLKPDNIFLASDGRVKVLDFGLAKVDEAPPGTVTQATAAPATTPGAVLGTVGYMSPEQVRGASTDHRSDIFSLGVVLYEMLTGQKAFARPTPAETMTAILREEPSDIGVSGIRVAPAIERLTRRALEKNPGERFHSAHDLALALETVSADSAPPTAAAIALPPSQPPLRLQALGWIAAAIAIGIAVWALWFKPSPTVVAPRITRTLIDVPADMGIWLGRGSAVAMAPDGKRIAYTATAAGVRRIYLRALDRFESTPLAGSEGAEDPFFSPDGRWIGFGADRKLKKIAVDGGRAITLADTPSLRGQAWAPDDTIVFTPAGTSPLWRVSASGGTPEKLTTLGDGELSHRWPQLLPDGKTVIYTVWNDTGFDGGSIAIETIGANDKKILVKGAGLGRVAAFDEHTVVLVYARPEGLLVAPLDLKTRTLTAAPVAIVDQVLTNLSGGAHYAISGDGTLVYLTGAYDEAERSLFAIDRTGASTELAKIRGLSLYYRVSPNGRRLLRPNTEGADRDVWIDDLPRKSATRLTFGGEHFAAIWTPDGSRVIFARGVPPRSIFSKLADGSGSDEQLLTGTSTVRPSSMSPDGRLLVYTQVDSMRSGDVWVMPLDGDRTPRPLLQTPFSEETPLVSPDGRWLAYQSNESGRFEIYIAPFPNGGAKYQISTAGGFSPVWSRDGRELFYRYDDWVYVVSIGATSQLSAGEPRRLFRGVFQGDGDVLPDGRLLLIKAAESEVAPRSIALVLNWHDELRAKLKK